MEGDSGDGGACPQLELRLGPPGGGREDHWALKNRACNIKNHHESQPLVSSFGYFPTQTAPNQYSLGFQSTISQSQHQRVPSSKEPERAAMELNDSKGKKFSANTAVTSSSQKRYPFSAHSLSFSLRRRSQFFIHFLISLSFMCCLCFWVAFYCFLVSLSFVMCNCKSFFFITTIWW